MHAHLNRQQLNIVSNPCGQLLIVSGPGTGKTGTLVSLISEILLSGQAKAEQIMAVTFTNRAAGEMRERIKNNVGEKVYVATLHSFAAQVLRNYPPPGFTADFRIIDESHQYALVNQIKKELNQQDHPAYIIEKLTLACNLRSREILEELHLQDFYRQYCAYKRQNNALDYDDLLLWCAFVFEKYGEALDHYRNRFSFLLVDEYQDINPVQHAILKSLARDRGNIVAVGDFDQAIYGFRGADVNIMLNFQRDFPNCKTYFLEQNYRSTQEIVAAANRLIRNNQNRREKPLWTAREAGNPIMVLSFANAEEEACQVVDVIREGVQGGKKYGDFAVLYRINILSRVYEEVFSSLGIPYQVFGGPGFFQRNEIQNILSFYRLCQNPEDQRALAKAASLVAMIHGDDPKKAGLVMGKAGRKPDPVWADQSLHALRPVLEKLRQLNNLEEIYDLVLDHTGYLDYLKQNRSTEGLRRLENVEELRSTLVQFGQTGKSLDDFLLLVDQVHAEKSLDTVKLMTSHAAKGMEFDTVFIVEAEEGMFPHYNAETEAQQEEERRLFYVSLTRAKNNLFILHTRTRISKGKTIRVTPSPFIQELDLSGPGQEQKKKPGKRLFAHQNPFDAAAPQLRKDDVCAGLLVHHAFFGKGVITEIRELPHYTELTVAFRDETRKIILEYAPLTCYQDPDFI
nr:UvrD-helicase domain-containing protein [Candidatus Formimonas warabiya]